MKAYEPTEHEIQSSFFQEAVLQHRLDPTFVPELLYAVLNGPWLNGANNRSKMALIEKYKEEGWKPGIPDVHYDQPRGGFNKLVFEFKKESKRKEKNGGVSEAQATFLSAIEPYAFTRVVYSVEEAVSAFAEYMALPVKE